MTTRTIVVFSGKTGPRGATGTTGATGAEGGTTALTTDGDVLTRAAGVPSRITRANLAADTAFTSRYMQVVNHGSTAGTARTGTAPLHWVGSVDPTNATNQDTLFRTDQTAMYQRVSSAWVEVGSARYAAVTVVAGAGIDPTGATDSTAAIQALCDALPAVGATLYFPPGSSPKVTGITISNLEDCTIEFGGGAWLRWTGLWGLTVTNCQRMNLHHPRFSLRGTTASGGAVKVVGSSWTKFWSPVIWAHANIPASTTGILVDANSYWCHVIDPNLRAYSGAITGTWAHGVWFRDQSNAGRVLLGAMSDMVEGVLVDGANMVLVDGTAFETGTYGVRAADPSLLGGNDGMVVTHCRWEGSLVLVRLDTNSYDPGTTKFVVANNQGAPSLELSNPSAYAVGMHSHGSLTIDGNDQSVVFRGDTNMGLADNGGALTVKAPGNVIINPDSDANGAGSGYLQSQSNNYLIWGPAQSGIMIGVSGAATQKLGFHGATPVTRSTGWAVTNATADKVFDANATSIDELADVLGTLITHLLTIGLIAP